jgi:mono/diheme cytochrome c family protein
MRGYFLGLGLSFLSASTNLGGAGDARAGSVGLTAAPPSTYGKPNPYEGSTGAARAGRRLFERHCAECHGLDAGGGSRGPALNNRTVGAAPPGALLWFLANGNRRAGMPSWSRFPDAQRWQIGRAREAQNRQALDPGPATAATIPEIHSTSADRSNTEAKNRAFCADLGSRQPLSLVILRREAERYRGRNDTAGP